MDISIITKGILKNYFNKWTFDPFNRKDVIFKKCQKSIFSNGKSIMSQGSLSPKIRFLGQKVCPVARSHTDRVTTDGTLSRFQDLFLQLIIKDRPEMFTSLVSISLSTSGDKSINSLF